ncbi:hypothetical protein D9M73_75470 [compost metagenome]|nr:MAG TPA: hypothetical protein [Caudoviricetes sp.]
MSKPLADFYDLLLPELPGCPVALLDLHLVLAARQFCSQSSAWREPFTPLDLVAGQADYYLDPPETQSEVVRLTSLTINDTLLWLDSDAEQLSITARCPKYRRNEPPFTLGNDLRTMTLMVDEVPTAAVTAGMVVEGAMQPKQGADRLPDLLLIQYSEAMRYGTLARLMVMAKKPWTDRDLAREYLVGWNGAMNYAAYQAQVGNTRQHLRSKKSPKGL